jgi:serine-type D-Ala-D-Ala carboxypeptidase/endopeptidase (penicillin-binding protein 4)
MESTYFSAMYITMKQLCCSLLLLVTTTVHGQDAAARIARAFQKFEKDSQLRHAIASLYVVDGSSGAVVFDRNSQVGLAPASTQKIITAATVYQLLGRNFRYQTRFAYVQHAGNATLVVQPSGDPTLGSWRWKHTADTAIVSRIYDSISRRRVQLQSVGVQVSGWDDETIPDGWIWQDVGNYYGAGAKGFNWRENQFDIYLKSGNNAGDSVAIVGTNRSYSGGIVSKLSTAAKGTGDNAYVYYPFGGQAVVRGTIPAGEARFRISASEPAPENEFTAMLNRKLKNKKGDLSASQMIPETLKDTFPVYNHLSPSMDSMVYWFLQKSINLYGEAFVKTLAFSQTGIGSTSGGVTILRNFWKNKGFDASELQVVDGSGLSPLNRVTTHVQVQVLRYAQQRDWFPGFFAAFPEYNGMKMKSGTINGAKAFCGYHVSRQGKPYIFSFIVNNYAGSASALVQKMYAVLNELK